MYRTRWRPSRVGRNIRQDSAGLRRSVFIILISLTLSACALTEGQRTGDCDLIWDCLGMGDQVAALPGDPAPADGHPVPLLFSSVPADDRGVHLHSRIITPAKPLQCVPYARRVSDIKIRGDARTWWRRAEGRYARSDRPMVGAVLALRPKGASRGHLAVVTHVLGAREIVVEHANWLNQGRIHKDTPVRDVSPKGDWSAVRVWYTPGQRYGTRTYRTYGFILPTVITAAR